MAVNLSPSQANVLQGQLKSADNITKPRLCALGSQQSQLSTTKRTKTHCARGNKVSALKCNIALLNERPASCRAQSIQRLHACSWTSDVLPDMHYQKQSPMEKLEAAGSAFEKKNISYARPSLKITE